MKKRIDEPARQLLQSFSKIGVLVTEDEAGWPHATVLNSLRALDETTLTFGQFTEGLSKRFLPERPRAGFLALTADMRFLRGSATYTHTANTGAEFDAYNDIPMFRYIFYLALDGITRIDTLDKRRIALGAILTRLAAPFCAKRRKKALPRVAKRLLSQMDSLKFLAYFDDGGTAKIVPVIQATHAGTDRIVCFAPPFARELVRIPSGTRAAVLVVNLNMESVLVKGVYRSVSGLTCGGILDVERVYNSMPPKMEYVYPRSERIEPVAEF